MDVKTAFQHGELDQVLYMEQPQGYEVNSRKRSGMFGKKPSLWLEVCSQ